MAACLFRRAELPAAGSTVAVLSGGNIDPAMLLSILGEPPPVPVAAGRLALLCDPCLPTRRPGSLLFVAATGLLYLAGARGLLLLGIALLVSGIASYVCCPGSGIAMSGALSARLSGARSRPRVPQPAGRRAPGPRMWTMSTARWPSPARWPMLARRAPPSPASVPSPADRESQV